MRGAPQDALYEEQSGMFVAVGHSVTTRDEIIQYYVSLTSEEAKVEFRNRLSDHYLGLMDRNYNTYTTRLFSEGIELAMGFDLAIIGLASTAALFEESADDLATVISAYSGAQSSVNKNLYFDRTLPALITTMDAQRTNIETEIIDRKRRSSSEYTVEAAIRDLRRYQHAGTLMRSVTQLTENASTQLAVAQTSRLNVIEYSCEPNSQLRPKLLSLQTTIGNAVNSANSEDADEQRKGREALTKLATPFGISLAPTFALAGTADQVNQLSLQLANALLGQGQVRSFCTEEQIDTLIAEITALGLRS